MSLAGLSAAAAIGLAACSSSTSTEGEASSFVRQHAGGAERAAAAVRALEKQASALSGAAKGARRDELAGDAARAHAAALVASEWNPPASSEAGSEEEDVPRAEAQVTEAAEELARAAAAIEAYTRDGRGAALGRYQSEMARARELWDEGISQLWFLAKTASPPTV